MERAAFDELITWLEGEASKSASEADKRRADALDALCSGRESGALFDLEARCDAMATAFRLAADKARFVRRRATGQNRRVAPVTVLGAATVGDHRGVLVERGEDLVLWLPDGSETPPVGGLIPYNDRPEAWRPLLREHDANRDAREGVA